MPLSAPHCAGKGRNRKLCAPNGAKSSRIFLQSRDDRCIDGPHAQQDRNGVLRALRDSHVENEEEEDGKEGDCQVDPGPRCQ